MNDLFISEGVIAYPEVDTELSCLELPGVWQGALLKAFATHSEIGIVGLRSTLGDRLTAGRQDSIDDRPTTAFMGASRERVAL